MAESNHEETLEVPAMEELLKARKISKRMAIGYLDQQTTGDPEIDRRAKSLKKNLAENRKELTDFLTDTERDELRAIIEATLKKFSGVAEIQRVGFELHQQFATSVSFRNTLQEYEERFRRANEEQQYAVVKINRLERELEDEKKYRHDERLGFEKEIGILRQTIRTLETDKNDLRRNIEEIKRDKDDLQRQINDMNTKMEKERDEMVKQKQHQEERMQQLSENNLKEIGMMRGDVDVLLDENRKLKTREPYKLVGYCVTLMTNALYKYVHQRELSKNYYSIEDLENHLRTKFVGDEDGRRAADRRWEELKVRVGWKEESAAVLGQLAENREKGSRGLNVSVKYYEFSDAIRHMFSDKEIDQSEMELVLDLYAKSLNHLQLEPAPQHNS